MVEILLTICVWYIPYILFAHRERFTNMKCAIIDTCIIISASSYSTYIINKLFLNFATDQLLWLVIVTCLVLSLEAGITYFSRIDKIPDATDLRLYMSFFIFLTTQSIVVKMIFHIIY